MLFLILPNLLLLGKEYPKKGTEPFKLSTSELKQFYHFYNDSLGLKTTLIKNYKTFKTNILKEPVWTGSMVQGKSGWYFLGNNYNHLLDDSFGAKRVSIQQMQLIKENILELKHFFDQQNIPFYLVVPPNKHRIYPEYLPYSINKKPNRLQQLKIYLKEEINFEIIDLTDTLLCRKKDRSLYYQTDSHWNDYGAFLGYSYTMNKLDENFKANKVSLNNYSFESNDKVTGDILKQVLLTSDENKVSLIKNTQELSHLDYYTYSKQAFTNNNAKYKLLMYRDSFANAWIPFFNESFGEVIYLRDEVIDKKLIKKEKPDVVIIEIVERNLFSSLEKFKVI